MRLSSFSFLGWLFKNICQIILTCHLGIGIYWLLFKNPMWNLSIIDIAINFLLKYWHFRYYITRDWIIFKSSVLSGFTWHCCGKGGRRQWREGTLPHHSKVGVEFQAPYSALWHLKGEGSLLLMWGLFFLLSRLLHGDKSLAVRYAYLLFPMWPLLTLWGMGVHLHLVGMKVPAPARDGRDTIPAGVLGHLVATPYLAFAARMGTGLQCFLWCLAAVEKLLLKVFSLVGCLFPGPLERGSRLWGEGSFQFCLCPWAPSFWVANFFSGGSN